MDMYRTDITNRAVCRQGMSNNCYVSKAATHHINIIPEGGVGPTPNGKLVAHRTPCCHGSRNSLVKVTMYPSWRLIETKRSVSHHTELREPKVSHAHSTNVLKALCFLEIDQFLQLRPSANKLENN